MPADRTEHPEPSETMPTPGASVRTRAVTRHSGGAASVGALAMGAVVLGALTAGTIAMRRTRILSDRAEYPEPSKTTPCRPGADACGHAALRRRRFTWRACHGRHGPRGHGRRH